MTREDFKTHLRSALAERRPVVLRHLLDLHGAAAFADGLAAWSPRLVADALSLLLQTQRMAVMRHLPFALRNHDLCVQVAHRHSSGGVAPPCLPPARWVASSTARSIP
ncbi:hypothetical protein RCH10_005298 [Variovorax sp. GrIS 2.14]|jgi:hypothetical protein|uniref:hypothetical protein n=1 Tax=unclassified Variovorax TaxID=663243 RepID=UPI002B239893|nr:hypothetical protein [Variovorax sp. RTB1]MEB0113130.1 hypothetical protein [Variovorax sp. RTB1]